MSGSQGPGSGSTHSATVLEAPAGRGQLAGLRRTLLLAGVLSLLLVALFGRASARADLAPAGLAALLGEQGRLLSEPGSELTAFGYSVAVSADGNTALIGARHSEGTAGTAWVFVRAQRHLDAAGAAADRRRRSQGTRRLRSSGSLEGAECGVGRSVALSADGNVAVVGSPADRAQRGGAWVFVRTGSTWSRQGTRLLGGEGGTGGHFGRSVAVSGNGNTVLVGGASMNQPRRSRLGVLALGLELDPAGPALTGGEEEDGEGFFGVSLALSEDGSTALIGAPGDDEHDGALWVFKRTGTNWAQSGAS